ncbi:MAG TPA: peptidoglycan recognition family protein [Candidatus Limnocylindrales bacterium]|jgi:N-acetylmuramoyl-L-alanine amidase CwlA|nr:peptidoglycan recognition family protein [Candidatus Limnocylindrales bacterium]
MDKTFVGCASVNFRPGRPLGFKPEAIVIHIAVGSLPSVDSQFNNPASKVSAHYCVGKKGQVHQYVHETDTAFHAGIVVNPSWPLLKPDVNPNFYTIGIEHEGLPDDVWPESQLATSAALVSAIAQRWNIPLDDQHVIRHHQIRASKTCPGNVITIAAILARAFVEPAANAQPSLIVRTITNLNLRIGRAAVDAPLARVIPRNTSVSVSGAVKGEAVKGNPAWYSDGNGNFLWAGGTDTPTPALP